MTWLAGFVRWTRILSAMLYMLLLLRDLILMRINLLIIESDFMAIIVWEIQRTSFWKTWIYTVNIRSILKWWVRSLRRFPRIYLSLRILILNRLLMRLLLLLCLPNSIQIIMEFLRISSLFNNDLPSIICGSANMGE